MHKLKRKLLWLPLFSKLQITKLQGGGNPIQQSIVYKHGGSEQRNRYVCFFKYENYKQYIFPQWESEVFENCWLDGGIWPNRLVLGQMLA